MELKEGAVIAERFRLVRQLGKGGMGEVWAAQHISLDIPCAVKFIHGESAGQAEVRMRFEREAKAAAQLRSHNVVQMLDYGVFEDVPYIAMEYLDGEPLNVRIKRRGRLDPMETFRIVAGVGKGLAKAHGAGIVHRDLKPENIFLVRDEDAEIPKVLDFGVAKSTTTLDSNTRTGALLGTPYYMSPEQAQGTKSVDHRADLWSLAVVTFRCITGELPFQSTALGDLLIKIVTHPLPVPSQRAPGVPEGFDAWWQRAAQRDPDHRYQSAKELVEALGLALNVSVPANLGQTPMPGTMQKTALWQATVVAEPSTSSGSYPALPFEQSAAGASGPYPAAAMTPPTGHTQAMPAGALPHFHPHAGQRLAESASGSVAGLAAPRRPSNNRTLAVVGAGLGLLAVVGIVVAVAAGSGGGEETGPATPTEPTATEAAQTPPTEPDPPPVADEEEEKTEPAPSATEAAPAPKTPSPVPQRPLPPPAPKAPPPEPTKAPGTPTTLDVPPPAPPPPTPKSSDPDFGF